jgi:hypothetical protein
MIVTALTLSIVLAASSLGLAYGLGGLWIPTAGMAAVGLLGILGQRANKSGMTEVAVALFVVAATAGAVLNLSMLVLVVGVIAALSAWNLDGLARELASVDAVKHQRVLQESYLKRLLLVDGLSFLLAAAAATVRLRLSFSIALLVALVGLVGLSRVLRFIRGRSG